jgi:hypothetical protein
MPEFINATNITPPRVALIDQRTGLIAREWYRFFLNLFNLTGGGTNQTSLVDLQLGPPPVVSEDINGIIIDIESLQQQPTQESALDQIAEVWKRLNDLQEQNANNALGEQIAELQKQIEGLQVQPQIDVAFITSAINSLSSAPVTKTADFTVANGDTWLINNKSGSTCTVTLPTASSYTGRTLHFQNYQAQTLVSASSNVVPLAGGAATTAILSAVAGANATLVSDGTNWIMTQYTSNNALLLE